MEIEDGQIYKSPCVIWPEESLLLYGSGAVLFIFNFKTCKLFKKIEYSELNEFVRSIFIDKRKNLVFVGFDNKTFSVYDNSFKLILKKSFTKKISFVASVDEGVVIGDFFGDISLLSLDLTDKSISLSKSLGDNCKIVVPFSHYSTITSSLVDTVRGLLYTGNKDGKIVINSLNDLHEIRDMSISCLEILETRKVLVSLSIDNTVTFWCLERGLELQKLVLEGSECFLYHFCCDYSSNLMVFLCLEQVLVINLNFHNFAIFGHFRLKIPFISQTSSFIGEYLYIVDHFSNLYRVKTGKLQEIIDSFNKKNKNNYENKDDKEVIDQKKLNFSTIDLLVVPTEENVNLEKVYENKNKAQGVKINVKKHINL